MKIFSVQTNVGKAKYVVNHHDGIKTHKDGSPFFDLVIFKNKKKMGQYISELLNSGYKEYCNEIL